MQREKEGRGSGEHHQSAAGWTSPRGATHHIQEEEDERKEEGENRVGRGRKEQQVGESV